MKHQSTILSILFTLALPVAAGCADLPTGHPTVDASLRETSTHTTGGDAAETGAGRFPSGKVVETVQSGGYSYAKLENNGKNIWVAYPAQDTRVGDTLSFSGCAEMPDWQSKSLNRKFGLVLFCGAPEAPGKSPAAKAAPLTAITSPGSKGAASAPAPKLKIDKATGANAYTVAEIFAKRSELNGKTAVVRGQVVKISPRIMGKNWLHLQDGSGNAKDKNHDLVVTTDDRPEVGDLVTVSGTLATDKDFGGGYKYGVIMEKGIVKK